MLNMMHMFGYYGQLSPRLKIKFRGKCGLMACKGMWRFRTLTSKSYRKNKTRLVSLVHYWLLLVITCPSYNILWSRYPSRSMGDCEMGMAGITSKWGPVWYLLIKIFLEFLFWRALQREVPCLLKSIIKYFFNKIMIGVYL